MPKYSLFVNFKLFILILDYENMGVDALISKIVQEIREVCEKNRTSDNGDS